MTTHQVREDTIEYGFIGTLQGLKYEYRAGIRDRATLEQNFREKFQQLNRVNLTDSEFARLLDQIVTPNVFGTAKMLTPFKASTRTRTFPISRNISSSWTTTSGLPSTNSQPTPT